MKDITTSDDFSSLIYEGIKRLPIMLAILIAVLYFLVSTDVFDRFILFKLNKGLINEDTNEKSLTGVIVTGIILGLVGATIAAL